MNYAQVSSESAYIYPIAGYAVGKLLHYQYPSSLVSRERYAPPIESSNYCCHGLIAFFCAVMFCFCSLFDTALFHLAIVDDHTPKFLDKAFCFVVECLIAL